MGLGIASENSRMRMPNPPQKRTTFIVCANQFGSWINFADNHVFQPCFAAEMTVLLGAEAIGHTVRWQLDVGISNDRIFIDVALEFATLDDAFGLGTFCAHFIAIHGLPVGHVHSVIIENFAGLDI